jgi:DeoR/GlpR family transcriptional regulator of sugar metabolism
LIISQYKSFNFYQKHCIWDQNLSLSSAMRTEERQKRIEQYLANVEFASLEELAQHVSASSSTVRRDLNSLAKLGQIRRTHGGACLVASKPDEYIFSQRETIQLAEKEAIGQAAAKLIQQGQSVIVDAGTTVFRVARQLQLQAKTLHIITNSLPVANLFASNSSTEVIVSGGVIYPKLGVLVGPLAVEVFSKTYADVAIMSGGGITLEGVSNSHALLVDIQRAMIAAASRVIFCFDHTKMGRRSVAHVCELGSIDTVVTDAGAPPALIDALRSNGVEVLVAGEAATPGQPTPAQPKTSEPVVAKVVPVKSPKKREPIPPGGNLGGEMSWD